MCITKYKIHRKPGLAWFGKDYVFAPCGKCEDCRNHSRYAWAWRLTSDVQHYVQNKGYRVGFVTLTYNDDHLPRFPDYWKNGQSCPVAGLPCFSKDDSEKLILYIRKVSHRERGMKDWLYFLACEYGPSTQRPHMHMIIAWPSKSWKRFKVGKKIKGVQYFENGADYVHGLIRRYWCDYANKGFICPKDVSGGGKMRSGKPYLPFEVSGLADCMNSAFYTAKYVTKDIYFMDKVTSLVSREDLRFLADYLPHHRQTKSLGFASIASLSDAEKVRLLNVGKHFLGSDKLSLPPLYIKNKLLFKPCYLIDSFGERRVKSEASDFFKRNFDLIMDKKEQYFDVLFESWKDSNYWRSSGIDEYSDSFLKKYGYDSLCGRNSDLAADFVRRWDSLDVLGCTMAQAYIYYYGIPYKMAFKDKKFCLLNRYLFHPSGSCLERISEDHYNNIQKFFGFMMTFVGWQLESQPNHDVDFVNDYIHQSLEELA